MNCLICGAQLPVGAMFCGECGSSSTATPLTRKRPDPRPSDTTVILPLRRRSVISVPVVSVPVVVPVVSVPVVVPVVSAPVDAPGPVPLQAPEPAPAPAPTASLFVLQFSTGETISALGTGLIGRRPLPQPTERVDILVQINDLGRSVSKSHLEFGQYDGEFWVSDRYSGNGTIIRRPDAVAVRCEPGRRYLVPRGSRVEIADQFFILN
ncbi:FHA domain-containing protein [Cryobacterium sp. TMT2-17-1]|uniref:FHA domain-containing protein n=1 Tax=Cryobacterium sp. TMT2-17-1 TaxID=1259248 RepID=UPI00106DBC8E|nr:FHA domain-containing protein [Cryobacterium sp. TMT2-17-1]TFC48430.1 FHA domain-containing protein [Cryobacterium sp. TMT2-17-1]